FQISDYRQQQDSSGIGIVDFTNASRSNRRSYRLNVLHVRLWPKADMADRTAHVRTGALYREAIARGCQDCWLWGYQPRCSRSALRLSNRTLFAATVLWHLADIPPGATDVRFWRGKIVWGSSSTHVDFTSRSRASSRQSPWRWRGCSSRSSPYARCHRCLYSATASIRLSSRPG